MNFEVGKLQLVLGHRAEQTFHLAIFLSSTSVMKLCTTDCFFFTLCKHCKTARQTTTKLKMSNKILFHHPNQDKMASIGLSIWPLSTSIFACVPSVWDFSVLASLGKFQIHHNTSNSFKFTKKKLEKGGDER